MSSINHFFLPPECFSGSEISFPVDTARQITRVLRLQVDDNIVVLNNHGDAFLVQLVETSSNRATGRITGRLQLNTETGFELIMCLALTQREKFEWMLQKCTELGVTAFIPMLTERSLVTKGHDDPQKTDRRLQIIREAAEQSHRLRLPDLKPTMAFHQTLDAAHIAGKVILLHESAETALGPVLDDLIRQGSNTAIALMIGPEGGFSDAEIASAIQSGVQVCSLGARILRMETAAITAAALAVEYHSKYKIQG